MINETILVQKYLNGEEIDTDILYRICFLLAKWFKENGCESKLCIRENIFAWANKYGVYIDINLNDCIDSAVKNTRRLTGDNPIKISKADIHEITRRFDRRNTRLIALGILCYAKQFADQNNEFMLPMQAFGKWIGIQYNHVSERYMQELIDYDYVVKKTAAVLSWRGFTKQKSPTFKIKVPIRNEGEWEIHENDIRKLYFEIFGC